MLWLSLAMEFTVGWNINTGLWNKLQLLTRKVVSGILHPYNSDKTNVKKSGISTKIDISSYRRAHRHASCSAGKICRRLWGRNMQQTALNLINTFWAPSNSWNFIQLSHHSFRPILLSLQKTFLSQWLYSSSTLPCHTQQSKQGRLL